MCLIQQDDSEPKIIKIMDLTVLGENIFENIQQLLKFEIQQQFGCYRYTQSTVARQLIPILSGHAQRKKNLIKVNTIYEIGSTKYRIKNLFA